jgi:hypothetical protein
MDRAASAMRRPEGLANKGCLRQQPIPFGVGGIVGNGPAAEN